MIADGEASRRAKAASDSRAGSGMTHSRPDYRASAGADYRTDTRALLSRG